MKVRNNIEKLLSPIFRKIESTLNYKMKIAIGLVAVLGLIVAIHSIFPPNDITASSVMITNVAKSSGGTGIIISSSETSSIVLTNSHVCRVVENGGLVTGQAGSFLVATYKHSQSHDLCLITVDGNLKHHTDVASRAPVSFYESAMISGHPALMPNVVTSGHFSGRMIVQVMKGLTPCTEEQKSDPNMGLLCMLVGGIPDVVQYDSTLVTATIMPGSSGSGVYNENKELSGVVFAGNGGGIGYALTVPYESMVNFLNIESKILLAVKPNNSLDVGKMLGSQKNLSEESMMKNLKEACSSENKNKLKEVCRLFSLDIIWNE